MNLIHDKIKGSILISQHTQRNWDLTKEIPQKDLDLIITAATQCPSKQNIAYYKIHAITDRNIIELIHDQTDGFTVKYDPYQSVTNSQVLANLLIVIEEVEIDTSTGYDTYRNDQSLALSNGSIDDIALSHLERDKNMAVGIATGYINLTASLLGYRTGYCACFDPMGVKNILDLEKNPILLMGIGFKDYDLDRRVHHKDHTYMFPVKSKQEIQVTYWK